MHRDSSWNVKQYKRNPPERNLACMSRSLTPTSQSSRLNCVPSDDAQEDSSVSNRPWNHNPSQTRKSLQRLPDLFHLPHDLIESITTDLSP